MSELVVSSTHEGLRAIGPWLNTVLEALDDTVKLALQTRAELAVHELATNVVDHSHSPDDSFVMVAHLTDTSLQVTLTDNGLPVDVAAIPEPDIDAPQVRGYGMMIVRQLVSDLDYERVDQHNIWTATFDIAPDPHAPTE